MKSTMKHISLGLFAMSLLLGGNALLAQTQPGGRIDPDQLSKYGANADPKAVALDRLFLNTAVQGGLAEIQLGTLATQKGGSDSVKQLGQKLVDDHTSLNAMLVANAKSMGVGVPDKPSKKDVAEYNKLNGLSGADFDKEFLAFIVKDHKKDLSDFKDELGKTQNPDLQTTVSKGIQMISMHLQMAQKLAGS